MNHAVSDVLLGIVANGLTSLLAHVGRKAMQPSKPGGLDLSTVLTIAAQSVAETIEWTGAPPVEEIGLLLTSPEIETLTRQIFSAKLLNARGEKHLDQIRREFVALFSLHTGQACDPSAPPPGVASLYNALVEGCENALDREIREGSISAHEIKSGLRHRLISDELAAIQKNLNLIAKLQKPDIQAIHEFEGKYRQQLVARHSHIIPPNFDAARKFPINDIYVPCKFTTSRKGDRPGVSLLLDTSDFLTALYRAVLLGNPGGGKSTFASKLCYDLASFHQGRLLAKRLLTPVLVVLRDYGAHKKVHSHSILQFIEATSNSKYQLEAPSGGFEYLLLNGRAAVIFDGLDELLDTAYRQEISSDVEAFCSAYPTVPILVTSREVGYEQAPLDEKRFEIHRLAPFDEDQVKEYATKWFETDSDLTRDQQKQKAQAFLDESRIVPDLRSNPLMLALMCNIYRGENYIPRNRPEIYEKCATMLFERWDKSRGLDASLPFEAHIGPAMKFLAYWIYSEEKLQGGVTERELTEKATAYLYPRRFEDQDEASGAALKFIEFCRGRAWVFTDTGTTREGERLYQFTHRTFLEFFAAAHLVRIHVTPQTLGPALLPRVARREWDVVAQLAFQLLNKNVEGAADDLLSNLLEKAKKAKGDATWNHRSFAARCLEFIIPSPKLTRSIATSCIEHCLAWGFRKRDGETSEPSANAERDPAGRLLGDLLSAGIENQRLVAETVEKTLVGHATTGSKKKSLLALEVGLHLTLTLSSRYASAASRYARSAAGSEVWSFWKEVSNRIFDSCQSRLAELYPEDPGLCLDGFWRGAVSADSLTQWHGVDVLFHSYPYLVFPTNYRAPVSTRLAFDLISDVFDEDSDRNLQTLRRYLSEVGGALLMTPTPWVRRTGLGFDFLPGRLFRHELEKDAAEHAVREPLKLEPAACFGAFAVFAIMTETFDGGMRERVLEGVKGGSSRFFGLLRWVFVGRYEHVSDELMTAEINGCGFSAEQADLVRRWISRDVNFARVRKRRGAMGN